MLMNRLETYTVNNPARVLLQKWLEAPWLARAGGRLEGGVALELGCGRGEGAKIILERFGAGRVVGIDLDPRQIDRARQRLSKVDQTRIELQVGDAARLEFPTDRFDAVFDFAILHHVPSWRRALGEIHRVLKPGGRFYFDEVLRRFLETTLARALFVHPVEGHFTKTEFVEQCDSAGLRVVDTAAVGRYFVIGVAEKERTMELLQKSGRSTAHQCSGRTGEAGQPEEKAP